MTFLSVFLTTLLILGFIIGMCSLCVYAVVTFDENPPLAILAAAGVCVLIALAAGLMAQAEHDDCVAHKCTAEQPR